MKMAVSSQTSLLAISGILVILGGMIGSPDGQLPAFVIAGLCALVVLLFGSARIRRMIALVILAVIILLAIPALREYRELRYLRKQLMAPGAEPISQLGIFKDMRDLSA